VAFPEHGNEFSGVINGGKFLDQLSDYQLLKDSVCSMELVAKLSLLVSLH
jgi:hypothetical protein